MNDLLTFPNILSLFRVPLIALFLFPDPYVRCAVIVAAACTDMLDGFLARRWGVSSRWGTLLDPLTDKLFVVGVLGVLWYENRVTAVEIFAFFIRDLSLFLFTVWLFVSKRWDDYTIRAFLCGKASTALQFLTLLFLALEIPVPASLFVLMALFGAASFLELWRAATR